jgi:hypothetical protein
MKGIFLGLCTFILINTAQATVVTREGGETPAAVFGYTILNAITEASPDSTEEIQKLRSCIGLSFLAVLTENCKAMPEVTLKFAEVQCGYSGAIVGPANCYVKKTADGTLNEVDSLSALYILTALQSEGAGTEGAAGHRYVTATNVKLVFDLGKFEGGAGAHYSFETEDFSK